MSRLALTRVVLIAAALALPVTATAHKMWLLPSATNVAGSEPWVTVDAAVSNDLFYPDHFPAQLSRLAITRPDGSAGSTANALTGKYRSVFDVALDQPGTWKIALVTDGMIASWEQAGERKRWRGNAAEFAKAVPQGAQKLEVSAMQNRVETFVSNGKPSDGALKPVGRGLELVPVTHVTDLVAGEPATFQLLLDGQPAAGLKVTAIAGAARYRNAPDELTAETSADGRFTLTWPYAGMYWVNASAQDAKGVTKPATKRRLGYTATLEVLPE